MRIIRFKISDNENNEQIKSFLTRFGVSSSLLKSLKQSDDGILLNKSRARSVDHLHTGDILEITLPTEGKMPVPSETPLSIIYEDEDIIAVSKPPFMPVHESRNHIGDTLSNAAAAHITDSFRAVYRLDRDTSGIVLIAKNRLAAGKLAGKVRKDYYAIVRGVIKTPGTIEAPIRRMDSSIIKRCVSEDGEKAVTHYFPVAADGKNTLLKINLETGKTHQIRVHFSYIGHPLLGDTLYGGDDSKINRQALHCRDIYFTHPITGEKFHLTCDFPQDIRELTAHFVCSARL